MLVDPVYVGTITSTVTTATAVNTTGTFGARTPFYIVDVAGGGSKRTGILPSGAKATLTISHSNSKENSPLVTRRTLVRLDVVKTSAEGRPVTASVYMVIAQPIGIEFTDAELLEYTKTLGFFVAIGETTSVGAWTATNYSTPRLLNGEG